MAALALPATQRNDRIARIAIVVVENRDEQVERCRGSHVRHWKLFQCPQGHIVWIVAAYHHRQPEAIQSLKVRFGRRLQPATIPR